MTDPTPDFDADPVPSVDDEEIHAILEHYDDPAHPEALSVAEVRELLADVRDAMIDEWVDRAVDPVASGSLDVVRDTGRTVVLGDAERREWNRLPDAAGIDDEVARTVVRVLHHRAARRIAGDDFEGTDPIVAQKPPDAVAGGQFVEAILERLLNEGLTHEEAWMYYGLEIRGYPHEEWIDRCGYGEPIAAIDAFERALDKLDG